MLDVYGGENIVKSPYTIKFEEIYEKSGEDAIRAQFKVTTPQREEKSIDIKFSGSFLACIGETERRLLLWLSWVKIKEQIDNRPLTSGEIKVFTNDTEWAKNVKQNLDSKICDALDNDGITYYPKKRIGF